MIYVIKGKYYILVSGYYKEVTVEKAKNNNGYDVILDKNANNTKIEASTVKEFTTATLENAYKNIKKDS